MKNTFIIPDETGKALEYLQNTLNGFKLKKAEINRAGLMAEEALTSLMNHGEGELKVNISRIMGKIKIEMTLAGERFDPYEGEDEAHILLIKSFGSDLKYRHSHSENHICITAYRSHNIFIYRLVGAALAALLLSLIIRNLCPESIRNSLSDNFFTVIRDMYMNALNMLIAPLVFFSIASSIAGFRNITDIGRIGSRLLGIYLTTTIICILVGFGITTLIKPYDYAQAAQAAADVSEYTSTQLDTSVKGFLLGIIPTNFVEPFLKADTIGIMFLAFAIGIAVILSGDKAKPFVSFLEAGNSVFLKLTDITVQLMPIMIFAYICVMLVPSKAASSGAGLRSMLSAAIAFVLTVVVMIIVYNLLLLFVGKLNPLKLMKKYAPHALKIMAMGSSSAAIPINVAVCEQLGVPSKIYSLSIPLGATVNMDGVSMYLAVFGLTFAKIYGIEITLPVLLSIAFTIIMLSAGAPTIYGISIICLSVLLRSLGVPVEAAIGQAVGMEVVAAIFRTVNNSIGDMVGTLIVASKEGLLDVEKYNA